MPSVDEIAKNPNYDASATASSKATIFVFIATFAYMALFSSVSPGFLGGAAFFAIGIFAVSLVISMPLFLLRAKAPRLGPLISIADIAITVVLTRAVYLWLFAQAQPAVAGQPFVVSCQEPIPEFSLDYDSNPSDSEVKQLCACVSSNLEGWAKDTARAISLGQEASVSALHMRAFPARFGSVVGECGGWDL